jgi:CBS domain-containing protein
MPKHVGDVMMPAPWTVGAECSLPEAARLMRAWDVREIFIVDDGRLCGVLTDADIIVWAIASGRDPSQLTAGDCHSPDSPRLGAEQPIPEALAYMRRHDVQRLPVIEGDQLVGTAWLGDLQVSHRSARPDDV